MPGAEVSTDGIVHDALGKGKDVFIPYIYRVENSPTEGPKSVMDMVSLHSLADYKALKPDSWGIPTPSNATISKRRRCLGAHRTALDIKSSTSNEIEDLDMIIMPGVAFDKGLARLGHGKGFYDFFLHRYHQTRFTENEEPKQMPFLGRTACSVALSFHPV